MAPTHSPPPLVNYSTLTREKRWIACLQQCWELGHRSPDLIRPSSTSLRTRRCSKHRHCFSVDAWFDVTSHTLISSHIRLSAQSNALTCVCTTLIYLLSAISRPFFRVSLAGLHPGIKANCCCDVNLEPMEGFKSSSVQQLADHSNFGCFLQGLPQWFNSLHVTLFSESSSLAPTHFMSSLTTSINFLFDLPWGFPSDGSSLCIQFTAVSIKVFSLFIS